MKNLLTYVIILLPEMTYSQKYVNKEWSSLTGMPVKLEWNASITNSNDELLILGNTYRQNQNSNILLTKYSQGGTIQWQVEYNNNDSTEDYGISLTLDEDNNIYVAGTFGCPGTNSLDLIILKYDNDGDLLWTYTWGGSNQDNVPLKIVSDGDEQLFITGYTSKSTIDFDIFLIKLEDQGNLIWNNSFDYNNLKDIPTGLFVDNQNSMVKITGISASLANSYDIISRTYYFNGNLADTSRSTGNLNIDSVSAIGMDTNGNLVVGGYYTDQTSNTMMVFMKFNDTLGLKWTNYFDHDAQRECKISDLKVTPDGMIFLTGHVEMEDNLFKAFTAKANQSGTVTWEYHYQAQEGNAFGKKLYLDDEGKLNIAGIIKVGDETNLLVMQYDTNDGSLLFSEEYNSGEDDYFGDITSDHLGNIYLQSISSTTSGKVYNTIKYSSLMREFIPVCDTDSIYYVDNELIICFNENYVKTDIINNKAITFGKLSDFIDDEVTDSLNAVFGIENINFKNLNVFKIFKDLTTYDTISISRLGDTVKVPPFWSTFVVQLPISMNEMYSIEMIDSLFFPLIRYSELNYFGELCNSPNDPLYDQFPAFAEMNGIDNANINVEEAWEIETGHPDIKVGIFDSGIEWDHDDFSKDGSNSFLSSKIKDGWDYSENVHIFNSTYPDQHWHGTGVAGIIGALRNNGIGVSGIAGGDMNVLPRNPGVSLYSFRIGGKPYETGVWPFRIVNKLVPNDKRALAIWEGAQSYNSFNKKGYNLNFQNHSWGMLKESKIIKSSIKFAFENACILIAASGNDYSPELEWYPSSFRDNWSIKVGASGQYGTREDFSMYGSYTDVLAPGTTDLYTLVSHRSYNISYYKDEVWDGKWVDGSGTSFSAPMVTGLASLLQSYVYRNLNVLPNLLSPEDIEYLIKHYASDQTPSTSSGYGLINAGSTIHAIEYPYYKIKHVKTGFVPYNNSTKIESDIVLELNEDFLDLKANVKYDVDVYKVTKAVNHNIENCSIVAVWPLNHCSDLLGYYNTQGIIDIEPSIQLKDISSNSLNVEGYIYHIKNNHNFPFTTQNKYVPGPPSMFAHLGYSLYLNDPNVSLIEQTSKNNKFNVLGNPSFNSNIIQSSFYDKSVNIELYDINGKLIRQVFNGHFSKSLLVNISDIEKGVYFYRINYENSIENIKFLKI